MTISIKTATCAVLLVFSIGLAACDTSPPPDFRPEATTPSVSKGMSRLLFFRAGGGGISSGGSFRPMVVVDGQEIAKCLPEKGFFVDVPAGKHKLEGRTNSKSAYKRTRTLDIQLKAGETTYISCDTYVDTMVRVFEFKAVDPAEPYYVRFLNTLVPGGPYTVNR